MFFYRRLRLAVFLFALNQESIEPTDINVCSKINGLPEKLTC